MPVMRSHNSCRRASRMPSLLGYARLSTAARRRYSCLEHSDLVFTLTVATCPVVPSFCGQNLDLAHDAVPDSLLTSQHTIEPRSWGEGFCFETMASLNFTPCFIPCAIQLYLLQVEAMLQGNVSFLARTLLFRACDIHRLVIACTAESGADGDCGLGLVPARIKAFLRDCEVLW